VTEEEEEEEDLGALYLVEPLKIYKKTIIHCI
jgi:hypothetical protein